MKGNKREGRLIVEFDTVGFHGDLSSSVRLFCQLVVMADSSCTHSSLLLVLFLPESSSSSDDQVPRCLSSVITDAGSSPGLWVSSARALYIGENLP